METGKAIYYLLKDSDAVGAICGDRIYPEIAQQDVDPPFVAYTVTDTTPSGTKSGSSDLDTARVEIYMISDDYAECMNLGTAVRGALDRVGGNVGPAGAEVAVQSIDFDSSDIEFDTDQRVYVLEHVYNIRVQRTGQAVSYSPIPRNTITVEEFDGDPTGAVNKIVFSNGTVTIAGNTARVTSGGGTLTIEEADGTPSATANTLVFPNGTVSVSGSTATLDLSLDTLDTTGILEQIAEQLADGFGVTSSDFPNGLIGDFNQDGYVGSNDLLLFFTYFGESLDSDATELSARLSAAFSAGSDAPMDLVRSINSETADREGDVNLTTSEIPEGTRLYYTDARVDLRINAALISDLSDTPNGIGTAGQVLVVNSDRTGYEFANQPTIPDHSIYVQSVNSETPDQDGDVIITTSEVSEGTNLYFTNARWDTRYATKTHYHNRYSTEAETERSGATATLEIYYTARPDGDGYAESEVSDVGETDTINRTLYYSTKYLADPDTAGDWTEYTTQPADNATFATAKAALLAGLNETDATAETRGTLPLSLKMVRTTTAAGDLLLDTYTGAAAAYSVRKLDKDYTGYCMRVREDSGDTEADIGFDGSGGVDQSAIATHCGSANGYVVTWYDQSGNSNNVTQSTAGNQPQIYNGTAVITENGKPALQFDGSNDGLTLSSLTYGNALSLIAVYNQTSSTRGRIWCDDITGQQGYWIVFAADTTTTGDAQKIYVNDGAGFDNWSHQNAPINQQNLLNVFFSSSQIIDSINGTAQTQSVTGFSTPIDLSGTSSGFAIANSGNLTYATAMKAQEFILYHSDQSSNRIGIESEINTYFSIY